MVEALGNVSSELAHRICVLEIAAKAVIFCWQLIFEVKSPEKCFLRVSTQNLCSRGGQGCVFCWQLVVIVLRVTKKVLVLKT